jgi:small subunit ribosomal protein S18
LNANAFHSNKEELTMAMENENRPARAMNRNRRKKVCQFCVDKATSIDYKDAAKLRRFISERSKILPRRTTGTYRAPSRETFDRARAQASSSFQEIDEADGDLPF